MIAKTIRTNSLLVIFILIFLIILVLIEQPRYETNDDMAIIGIITGQYGQPPQTDGLFISKALSVLFFYVYTIVPNYSWYSMFLYLIQVISLLFGMKVIINANKTTGLKFFYILGFISLYVYLFYRLNFSSTSLFLFFTISIYYAQLNLNKVPVKRLEILLGILLAISYMIRPSTYYILILYTLPLLGTFIISKNIKRFFLIIVSAVLLAISSYVYDNISRSNELHDNFENFNSARSKFMDTGLGDANKNTPQALNKVNWTQIEYKFANTWFMHNEDLYNTELIKEFIIYNKGNESPLMSMKKLKESVTDKNIRPYYIISFIFIIMTISTLKCDKHLQRNKFLYIYGLLTICYVIFGIIGIASVRFPMRISIPLLLYLFLLCTIFTPRLANQHISMKRLKIIIVVLIMLTLMITSYNLRELNISDAFLKYNINSIKKVKKEYGEDIIFTQITGHSFTQDVNPLNEFSEIEPYNKVPGGWQIGSPIYYSFLKNNGFETGKDLIEQSINNDRVIYVYNLSAGKEYKYFKEDFESYLNRNHGGKSTLYIDVIMDHTYKNSDGEKTGLLYLVIKSST